MRKFDREARNRRQDVGGEAKKRPTTRRRRMSEQTEPTAGEQPVDPSAAISRGVGLSLESVLALDKDSPAGKAWTQFGELVERYKAAEAAYEELKLERNQAVYELKTEHNVGFSAMAEVMGVTSSLVLYVYERAQGKTAKQIREESVASRIAKEATRVVDPNKPAPRKQTPEEKAFRKVQREQLKSFLQEQRDAAAARGDSTEETDASLADVDREEAAVEDT
jgi:hypothetical protein